MQKKAYGGSIFTQNDWPVMENIIQIVHSAKEQFLNVQSDKTLNFESEANFACQALLANEYALKIALNNKDALIRSIKNISAIGISLNPAKKQAYLVPRNNVICLDISYMGLMDLATATGSILWVQADVVRDKDQFELNTIGKEPTHKHNPFAKDRGEIVGAYVIAKTKDGDYLTDCMSIDEINAIKARSQAVKSGKTTPWNTDPVEMYKKTVVKRAYKYWPRNDRLEKAIHYLNNEGGEGLVVEEVKVDEAANAKLQLAKTPLSENQVTDLALAISEAEDMDALKRTYTAAYRTAQGQEDKKALDHFIQTYNDRKMNLEVTQ